MDPYPMHDGGTDVSSLAGAGYLRRRDGAIMTPDPLERHRELIALPAWVRISCAAAASLKAHTCELRIPSRNSPDTFETVHYPRPLDPGHACGFQRQNQQNFDLPGC